LLGVGDGILAVAVNYAAGDAPRSVAIGDLDGDQVPDLAVANHASDNVSVLLGLGDGTFAAAVHYAGGDRPSSVAIGDLDGDQMPDLAVASSGGGNVSVLLNQLPGLFLDCNGNGIPDKRDIEDGTSQDCNTNTIPDECDIADGTSADDNGNGIPDECELAAHLDIKPGSCPNPVNPRSRGVVPMAIIGSESFDVTQIDVGTLTLRRADDVGGTVAPLSGPPGPGITTDDVATPFTGDLCDCHDLGGDGIDDLLLKFSTLELAGAFQLSELPSGASMMLTLSGSLLDGTAFEGSDCVVIPGNPARAKQRRMPRLRP
ncbi:MAG: FG-GAP repeat domain-containing protein, partial [Planctomycetota bacterium]